MQREFAYNKKEIFDLNQVSPKFHVFLMLSLLGIYFFIIRINMQVSIKIEFKSTKTLITKVLDFMRTPPFSFAKLKETPSFSNIPNKFNHTFFTLANY